MKMLCKCYILPIFVLFLFILHQGRLNEIITSGANAVPEDGIDGSSDTPWMIDGAGLPPNASELLPKLVICTSN